MQMFFFKIPFFKLHDFVKFTEMMDISILVSYKEDGLIQDQICGYIRLNKNPNIPKEIQVEKLNEKYSSLIKEA